MKLKQITSMIAALALAISFQGCTLFSGTTANSTPALSAQVSSNVVIAAEKSLKTAKDSIDLFLHLEYDNRELVKKNFPEVHNVAEMLRRNAPKALDDANKAKNTFKHNRNAENQASLMTAWAVVTEYVAKAQQNTIKINQP